ncbi:ribonuclease H-like domain-containing protein [Biscogniauxia mediterranea]|nr:ribonuclease H-like domain-containing protein [Biscogniauxia mediterranea]
MHRKPTNNTAKMDVDGSTFWQTVPRMLNAIRNARFVAIDVEMTGISSPTGPYRRTISTQDDYTRAKEAAEAHQIVEIGFTCCHYVEEASAYTTTSFNCSVSPLFPKSDFSSLLTRYLNRRFSVTATSFSFLRDNSLSLFRALENGVPYLRRDEQRRAEQLCSEDSAAYSSPINILELDQPSRLFYERCHERLASMRQNPALEPILIASSYGDKPNHLQIRMIDQLIREDFPEFIAKKATEGTSEYILVRRTKASDKVQAEAQGRADLEEVDRLAGLRLIFEALTGGSFARHAHHQAITSEGGELVTQPCRSCNGNFDFDECEAALKKKRPILVGHNMLYDLVFIYNTFFGVLPDSVDDFLLRAHELFPRLVDTKYMHTRGHHHMMHSHMSLEELQQLYGGEQFPYVSRPATFQGRAHRAGYDSALTMNLFLKQAYGLLSHKKHLVAVDETVYRPKKSPYTNPDEHSEFTPEKRGPSPPESGNLLDQDDQEEEQRLLNGIPRWTPMTPTPRDPAPRAPTATESDNGGGGGGGSGGSGTWGEAISLSPPAVGGGAPPRPPGGPGENYSAKEAHILPLWASPFWQVYGNKTRGSGSRTISFV